MKKKLTIVLFCLSSMMVFAPAANAQTKKEEIKEEVFSFVDTVPQFKGGREALIQFLTTNMEFPAKATKKGVKKGKVYVEFVVKKDGNIVNTKIAKTSDELFNKEAIRLVELMPAWTPGHLNGKIVNTRITLPIKFGYDSVLDVK
jgi:protein TonB